VIVFVLGITGDENDHAIREAVKALDFFDKDVQD
jgi:hypothetical protein